jgi:hypothetical protein
MEVGLVIELVVIMAVIVREVANERVTVRPSRLGRAVALVVKSTAPRLSSTGCQDAAGLFPYRTYTAASIDSLFICRLRPSSNHFASSSLSCFDTFVS